MTKLSDALCKKFYPNVKEQQDKNPTYISAVIVCAGNSTRMGLSKSKQFIDLLGKPAVYYTIAAFERSIVINEIVIVCRNRDKEIFKEIAEDYNFKKVSEIVTGGETRSISVKNGIEATSKETTHIAVHDGARCLITTEEIDKVTLSAVANGPSALGVPVKDTIKIINPDNTVKDTPDRSRLRAIQTPQVFSKSKYLKYLAMAESDALDFTDDCKLFEYCGETVNVVEGLYTNIKLTTQDDILVARKILESRKNL